MDETGFNLHSTNNYGYSPANVDAIRHITANRGRDISLIAIMSLHQFANFNFIDGVYTGETFVEFLKDLEVEIVVVVTSNIIRCVNNICKRRVT